MRQLLPIMLASTVFISACSTANDSAQNHTKINQPAAAQSSDEVVKALQEHLTKSGAQITAVSALPTAMPDIYWVSFEDAPAMFTNKTGEYLIQGQIIKLGDGQPVDITAEIQANLAKENLAKVSLDEMIIYPAKGEHKAAVYVFSDPTCHYCQLLHKDIDDITAGGVEVRYLAWPRAEKDIPLTQAIWCSQDRHAALSAAKLGNMITANDCDNPVQKHLALGRSLGISGTPAIFTESGEHIGGYIPAKELIQAAIERR
ncbi:DsbC family protein [Moraxella canis]|uniref:Thiol:disulfide interchange protein n=1 Tax=Moraxella canis TaxID=90239 RepID=A0ABZ0WX20_9GAMM|nr:DsbC family protein [Moraxella canis]WQE03590.1 DsbC family protein [Moraxella canis]